MAYAARHPGMSRAAVSYSGLLHTRYQGGPVPGRQVIQDLLGAFDQDPYALWGDPARHSGSWAGRNPYDLAPRLRGVRLFISVGNGEPGPLDGQATGSRHSGSSGPSIRRTRRWSSGWDSSASPLGSTPTAQAPTPGPTGSASCTDHCPCCWTASNPHRQVGRSYRPLGRRAEPADHFIVGVTHVLDLKVVHPLRRRGVHHS
jgi:hypothetical protein